MKTSLFRFIACLLILVGLASTVFAQTRSSVVGAWMGRWNGNGQHGEIAILIGPNGEMNGAILNTALPNVVGQWVGHLAPNGQMQAKYAYPNIGVFTANGRFSVTAGGELVGRVNFANGKQSLGIGSFQLEPRPALALASAQAAQLCAVYRTMCHAPNGPTPQTPFGIPGYSGVSPTYPVSVIQPGYPIVVQSGLNALPPAVREALYPPQVRAMVQNGQVDAALRQAMQNAQQLMGAINGTGPGGAAYTNQAVIDLLRGNSLIWQLGANLSPYALPLDRGSCKAAGTC